MLNTLRKMSIEERISIAQQKTKAITYHLGEALRIHENNAFVVYSKTLAGQIPRSYAAYAFKTFQDTMFQYEIVAICRLWDRPELKKENIRTIAALIDDDGVLERLSNDTKALWSSASDQVFAQTQATKTVADLRETLYKINEISNSSLHSSIMNIRDKHFAHSLEETRREKTGPVDPLRYGDEKKLLELTIPIVETFYMGINSTGYSFEESRQIWKRHSKALWEGVKVSVLE